LFEYKQFLNCRLLVRTACFANTNLHSRALQGLNRNLEGPPLQLARQLHFASPTVLRRTEIRNAERRIFFHWKLPVGAKRQNSKRGAA
jgi:hypothetical protein